tara:strand:+ start:4413 stop:5909 length:1497 start_codon:yes stop_codon:yes gene_type:complete
MSYLEKSELNSVLTFLILTIFFLLIMYEIFKINRDKIKKDWAKNRCHPGVVPFAGFINEDPTKSPFVSTAENMTHCANTILSTVVKGALKPLYYSSGALMKGLGSIGGALNNSKVMFSKLRASMGSISLNIVNSFTNMIIPIQKMMILIKSVLAKFTGVLTTSMNLVEIAFKTLKGTLGALLDGLVSVLIALAVLIYVLWIWFPTWPGAIVGTIFFGTIASFLGIIAYNVDKILDLQAGHGAPVQPSCFDKNTILETKNGEKRIDQIKLGDILGDGGRVTAVLTCNAACDTMYRYKDIIVSGTHSVFDGSWQYIKDHPDSILLEHYDEPYVYCLNTTTKQIIINGIQFSDWDDIEEWSDLQVSARKHIPFPLLKEDVHTYLDGGFEAETPVSMKGGAVSPIKDIQIGDTVEGGGIVLAIVQIASDNVKKYIFGKHEIVGGPNLQYEHLGKKYTLDMNGERTERKNLHHIITSNDLVPIHGIKFYDYNHSIETFLNFYL